HTRSKRDWSSDVCSSDLSCLDKTNSSYLHHNAHVNKRITFLNVLTIHLEFEKLSVKHLVNHLMSHEVLKSSGFLLLIVQMYFPILRLLQIYLLVSKLNVQVFQLLISVLFQLPLNNRLQIISIL